MVQIHSPRPLFSCRGRGSELGCNHQAAFFEGRVVPNEQFRQCPGFRFADGCPLPGTAKIHKRARLSQ